MTLITSFHKTFNKFHLSPTYKQIFFKYYVSQIPPYNQFHVLQHFKTIIKTAQAYKLSISLIPMKCDIITFYMLTISKFIVNS